MDATKRNLLLFPGKNELDYDDDVVIEEEEEEEKKDSSWLNKFSFIFSKKKATEEVKNVTDKYILPSKHKLLSYCQHMNKVIEEKINSFPKSLDPKFTQLEEALKCLKKLSRPNNCLCAGIINEIPGWRCEDCFKNANTILCHSCYLMSKYQHIGHRLIFLRSSSGMCDCGDADAMTCFCPNHSGLLRDKNKIEKELIETFGENRIKEMRKALMDIFTNISNYLLYMEEINARRRLYLKESKLKEKMNNGFFDMDLEEQDDIEDVVSKRAFAIFDQFMTNFVEFIFKITSQNSAMIHLISEFMIKNYNADNVKDTDLIIHDCIRFSDAEGSKFEIEKKFKKPHICHCPFLRVLLTNLFIDYKKYDSWIIPFNNSLIFQNYLSVIFLFLCGKLSQQLNQDLVSDINFQFVREENFISILSQSDIFDKFLCDCLNLVRKFVDGREHINEDDSKNSTTQINHQAFLMKKALRINVVEMLRMRKDENGMNSIYKLIDCACVIQNRQPYKSIVPHPPSTDQKFDIIFFILAERDLINAFEYLTKLFIAPGDQKKIKEVFYYFSDKIINKRHFILEKNQYSIHKLLYRLFSVFLNHACVDLCIDEGKDLLSSFEYVRKNLIGENEFSKIAEIVLEDMTQMFSFVLGTNDLVGLFKYYPNLYKLFYNYYQYNEFYMPFYIDSLLMKYLILGMNKPISFSSFLTSSNLELSASTFNMIFMESDKNMFIEIEEKKLDHAFNFATNYANLVARQINLLTLFSRDFSSVSVTYLNVIYGIYCLLYKRKLIKRIKNCEAVLKDFKEALIEQIRNAMMFGKNLCEFQYVKNTIPNGLIELFSESEFKTLFDEMTNERKINGKILYELRQEHIEKYDANSTFYTYAKNKVGKYILEFQHDMSPLNVYFPDFGSFQKNFMLRLFKLYFLVPENIDFSYNLLNNLYGREKRNNKFKTLVSSVGNELAVEILNFLSSLLSLDLQGFDEFKDFMKDNNEKIKKIYEILLEIIVKGSKKNETNDNNIINDKNSDSMPESNLINLSLFVAEKIYILKKKNILIFDSCEKIPGEEEIEKKDNIKKNLKKRNLDLKKKLKNKFKKNAIEFKEKLSGDAKALIDNTSDKIENNESKEEDENKIMCFVCRNQIVLNSMKQNYGLLCNIYNTNIPYHFSRINSINVIKTFAKSINISQEIIDKYVQNSEKCNLNVIKPSKHMSTCGHYYHFECFLSGLGFYTENENEDENDPVNFACLRKSFKCSLCNKFNTHLCPAFSNMVKKVDVLQKNFNPEKFFSGMKNKENSKENESLLRECLNNNDNINSINTTFVNFSLNFLATLLDEPNIKSENLIKYTEKISIVLKDLSELYENTCILGGTTFHKQRQIEIIQDVILSVRYAILKNNDFEIYNKILSLIYNLIEGAAFEEDINENKISSVNEDDMESVGSSIIENIRDTIEFEQNNINSLANLISFISNIQKNKINEYKGKKETNILNKAVKKFELIRDELLMNIVLVTDSNYFNFYVPIVILICLPYISILEFLKEIYMKVELKNYIKSIDNEKANTYDILNIEENDLSFKYLTNFIEKGRVNKAMIHLLKTLYVMKVLVNFNKNDSFKNMKHFNEISFSEILVNLIPSLKSTMDMKNTRLFSEETFSISSLFTILSSIPQPFFLDSNKSPQAYFSSLLEKIYNSFLLQNKNQILSQSNIIQNISQPISNSPNNPYQYSQNQNLSTPSPSFSNNDLSKSSSYITSKSLSFFPPTFSLLTLSSFITPNPSSIPLPTRLFSILESILASPCIYCGRPSPAFFLCLSCGRKFCNSEKCKRDKEHVNNCGIRGNLLLNSKNGKINYVKKHVREIVCLYIREDGTGLSSGEVEDVFELSKENLRKAMVQMLCDE